MSKIIRIIFFSNQGSTVILITRNAALKTLAIAILMLSKSKRQEHGSMVLDNHMPRDLARRMQHREALVADQQMLRASHQQATDTSREEW